MESVGYWELLSKNRHYRHVYLARLVSLFGDWFALLAILALLRSIGAGSAADFAFVLILKNIPALIASPWAGYFADRFSRIRVMVATDLIRAVLVSLFFLVWF